MTDSIATAYVSIKPDLDGFRDELKAGLDSETDVTKRVTIDAETGKARVEIDELQARIDELGSRSEVIKIGTTGSARGQIKDIQDALLAFQNETIVPGLDPGRLEQINTELDGLDGRLRAVGSDLDTTSAQADRTARSLGQGDSGAGTGLVGVALAAAPALGAMGAVGAGALGAVAVAGAAAVTGLGAFGLAAKDNLTAAKGQASALYDQWQRTTTAFTEPVIQDALGLLPGVFNLLTPSVAATSSALSDVETQLAGALGSPYWRNFSTFIAGEGGQAVRSFSSLFGGLATLLAGAAEGFAPELARIDGDFQRWGADLSKWGNEARQGGMSSFIDYLQQNGPLVAHTFEQLGSDVLLLAKDSAPLGPIWLNIADVAATLVGDLEKLNPTLTTWAVGLGGAAYAANRLLLPLGGLAAVSTVATGAWSLASDAFAVGATGVYAAASASSGLTGTIVGLLPSVLALAPGLDLVAAAALNSTGAFDHFGDAFASGAKAWAQDFVQAIPAGTDAVKAVNAELDGLNTRGNTLGGLMSQLAADTGMWGQTVGSLTGQYAGLGASLEANGYQPAQQLGDVYKDLADNALPSVQDQIKDLKGILPGLTTAQNSQNAAQQQAATALGLAAGYTGNLALQYGTLSQQLNTANTALSQTESLLNSMLGIELSVAQTTTGFYQSVDNLTSSLKTNGTQLSGTTTAALANQQAFEGVGSSIESVIGSMEKQGATSDQIVGKVQSLTGDIETQAGKYGLTKGQVDDYLHSLGLTPAQVKTDLQLSGYQTASTQVSTIQSQLNALNGRHVISYLDVVTTSTLGTGTAQGGMGRFAAGTTSAPGGPSLVGEEGPELMIDRSGQVAMLGTKGPEVRDIPRGAAILTASETTRLPRHADGVGPVDLRPITVSYSPSVVVQGSTDERTIDQIHAVFNQHQEQLMDTIAQLIPA